MMDTMESSFYNNNTMKKSILKSVKSNMTLDFNDAGAKSKQKKVSDLLLNSPDINMLKLASPELERLIIQQGNVTTTPTPTTQILFPRSVTEEQEAYARGFVDALAELHHDKEVPEPQTYTTLTTVSNVSSTANQLNTTVPSQADMLVGSSRSVATAPQNANNGIYTYSTVTQLPGSVFSASSVATSNATVPTTSMTSLGMSGSQPQDILVHNNPTSVSRNISHPMQFSTSAEHTQLMQIKEEPQRVPSLSPQLTPIDMGAQEGIKLERKRARNRVAARKCRTRKLERISRLEDRVSELKGHNGTLVQSANELREQVMALKQQILEHVNSGCKVMLSANML